MAKSAKSKVDDVLAAISLVGGRSSRISDAISIAPSIAPFIHDAARVASDAAVDLRQAESELADVCSRDEINLNRVRENTAQDFYGTSAHAAMDAYVRVTKLQQDLKRAVRLLEIEYANSLATEAVREELANYASAIVSLQTELMAREDAVRGSVDALRTIISASDELKAAERSSGAGNAVDKNGDRATGDAVINRHRRLADALRPVVVTA